MMDPFNTHLRKLQETWGIMEKTNPYVDHIRNHVDEIKASVESFLDQKIKEKVSQERNRRNQQILLKKLKSKVSIAEIGVYGSAVTGNYQTYPDHPADIDVFVRLTVNMFFQGQDWWNSTDWQLLQQNLAIKDERFDKPIFVDVNIIGVAEEQEKLKGPTVAIVFP